MAHKLADTAVEREYFDNLADLFSIIRTSQEIEKAYMRDALEASVYAKQCSKLIAQFRTLWKMIGDKVSTLESFAQAYRLNDCQAAIHRLTIGVPATVEYGCDGDGEGRSTTKQVAETVQYFITAMDSLKLEMSAVDEIYPLLQDLLASLTKLDFLSAEYTGTEKVKNWLSQLNSMRASENLDEEQLRQMLFDLESAYNEFHRSLVK